MRRIQSPGVEINEIDRSGRQKPDYSLPNAPITLQFGFAESGEDYNINWINTKSTYIEKYGYPTNEPETYSYNSVCEILDKGGISLMAKLPYDNNSYGKYSFVEYSAGNLEPIAPSQFLIDGKYITVGDLQRTLQKVLDVLGDNYKNKNITTLSEMANVIVELYKDLVNKKIHIEKVVDIRDNLKNLVDILKKYSDYWLLYFNDTNITSYIEFKNYQTGWTDIDEVDKLMTYSSCIPKNKIRIYDISRQKYRKYDSEDGTHFISSDAYLDDGTPTIEFTDDFLGIVPVIVSPANAMYFQNLLNVDSFKEKFPELSSDFENYSASFNPVQYFRPVDFRRVDCLSCQNKQHSHKNAPEEAGMYDTVVDNQGVKETITFDEKVLKYLTIQLSSDEYDVQSLSKIASDQFQLIDYKTESHLNTRYLKQIGVVVFKAFKDVQNNGKISFALLESFIGSLDRTAKDQITNSSIYIDNIVNQNSQYIRLFSNIDKVRLRKASTLIVKNQIATSLGFYHVDCIKDISYDLSIMKALTIILDRIKDPNILPLDIIVDAGISNIAQLVKQQQDERANFDEGRTLYDFDNTDFIYNSANLQGWKSVLNKIDNHCKNIRKDCIFIADGLRSFCIDGNQKIVRKSNIGSSVEKNIIPKLKHMTCLNSSYSAGYCNWYWIKDAYTDFFFWCPPSIKAAGIYIYCDTYFHPWSAPAGLTRGILQDVYDTAFTPDEIQAGKIYNQQWNYAINYPLDGIVVEGQKTFQTSQTALDRINVRRLMLYLEKRVRRISKYFLYEGNTEYNRQRFVDTIRPIFEDAKVKYGINDYIIKCDSDINTIDTIENHELHCRIAVKPVKCIEFIICDFIITNQSMSVSEEVNK